jgi:hypothetical protein
MNLVKFVDLLHLGRRRRSASDLTFYFDVCTKFHRSIFIKGWCHSASAGRPALKAIKVKSKQILFQSWELLGHLAHLGENSAAFEVHLHLTSSEFPNDLSVSFEADGHAPENWTWQMIYARMMGQRDRSVLTRRFRMMIQEAGAETMLDIGGRARSGLLRANDYSEDLNVDVLDILPGNGVTIVCDAHEMSKVIGTAKYDAILCVSVFEHLIMPWKVAVEMNRVLRMGGIALIHTHQTIGMHDLPWDFFRFSSDSWKGMFNHATGFDILGTEQSDPQFIIPFEWSERHREAEKGAGFEGSTVLLRKTSEATVDWPLTAKQVTLDMYPT